MRIERNQKDSKTQLKKNEDKKISLWPIEKNYLYKVNMRLRKSR